MQHENQSPPTSFPLAPFLGVALAATMIFSIGIYAVRSYVPRERNPDCYEQEQPGGQPAPFAEWPKPLVAVVLSGQMHGFYDKCGCSDPQYGGLPRRYNFVQALKAKGWDVVGIDLGEVAEFKGIQKQSLLKYQLSMRALGAMNYRAVGIGRDDILLGVGEALAELQNAKGPFPPGINVNLEDALPEGNLHKLGARQWEIIDLKTAKAPKIGVINLMGPDIRDELKPIQKFVSTEDELPKALKAFADGGVEIGVILHHEYPDVKDVPVGIRQQMQIEKLRKERAVKAFEFCEKERKKNAKIPPIQLVMMLTADSEPSAVTQKIGPNTELIEIGHKGRYIGLVGIYRAGKGYAIRYEMIMMGPEWETKKGAEKSNPILAMMEDYNNNLKAHNVLDMYDKKIRTKHPNQVQGPGVAGLKATYVGSDACKKCHEEAFAIWKKTPHSHATETLEGLKNPAGRHFDPECMMCHTTGFKHSGGYNDLVTNMAMYPNGPAPMAADLAAHNKLTRGVGCESCHGPGSAHAKSGGARELINAYRLTKEERDLEELGNKRNAAQKERYEQLFNGRMRDMGVSLCQKCHDQENDVNWGKPGKDTADKWRPLVHRTPKQNNNGGVIPAPPGDPPAIRNDPPLIIEIFQDKKK